MMGAGKTTLGRLLARELKYYFFDTDALVSQLAGQSIAQIFATDGEEAFRQWETQVLAELSAHKNLVVATGGGSVLRRENWSYLHHGIVLWLDVPVEQLYARLQEDRTRPLLQEGDPLAKLQALLKQRERLYAQADVRVVVTGGETPEELTQRAIQDIKQVLKPEVKGEGGRTHAWGEG
ncbi:MAG: shikimate kinase [Actinomycetota bacterium]